MNKIKIFILFSFVFFLLTNIQPIQSQPGTREEIMIPDIPGYKTLKCDFHIHTMFSDGQVWPDTRVEEAWEEGLDAIAITDHIEWRPHKEDVSADLNRPYEIAQSTAEQYDILLIQGAEITRKMPPGHLNAIFLKDVNPLNTDKWEDALQLAKDQGAYIFWNHPGWTGQQPDGIARWYDEHTMLLEKKMINGIEIINYREYYEIVHQWCVDKKITILANSDIHSPTRMFYEKSGPNRRPVTLVFAKERTLGAIKETLFAGRTATLWKNELIGNEEFLKPIFDQSIWIKNQEIILKGKQTSHIQIFNHSEIDFELVLKTAPEKIEVPKEITLYGGKTVRLRIKSKDDSQQGKQEIAIPYTITNLKTEPAKGLPIELKLNFVFEPAK